MFRICASIAASLVLVCAGADAAPAAPAPLPLIPIPAQVQPCAGHFAVTNGTVVSVPPGSTDADWSAKYLADFVAATRGLRLVVEPERTAAPGSIRLELDPASPVAEPEGYAIDVGPHGASVRARDAAGLFYGAVSVWQLLTAANGPGPDEIPCVEIRDWPRFRWRGLMLDSARHLQSVPEIERVLDQMALHKLNVFHWHLTDDQGWRLQIKRYPNFTAVGAWRTPPGAGTHGEPARYGGFYTQAEVRGIVAYAAARHITVVPELDMPGHAQAAVASYPKVLASIPAQPQVGVDWGVNPWLYGVSDASLAMIRSVLDEVMQLFPSKVIHVGGDEAIKNQWRASPAAQAKIKALGLKDEDALQSWFIGQIGAYLAQHGRRLMGWDEILEGGSLPGDAVVESWHGTAGAVAAAKLGHDAVLAPEPFMYIDHLQSTRSDEPSGRFPVLTLAKVYSLDPAPPTLDAAQAAHVLGVEAPLWAEFMNSPWEVQHALFPRLDALAEVAWSPQASRHFDGFLARLPAQLQRYRALGIDVAGSAFAVDIGLANGRNHALATGAAKVTLANQTRFGAIHYTLDGTEPMPASPVYAQPFAVKLPATVRATAFAGTIPLAAASTRVLDEAALMSRDNSRRLACAGQQLGTRVPLLPDLGARDTPQFNIDPFASCWIYPQADLGRVKTIRVNAARLARNEALADDEANVIAYPHRTPQGELEVHRDTCDGPLLADVTLPAGSAPGDRFTLNGALTPTTGVHDLCLRITAPIRGPQYAIGSVRLLPDAPADHARRRPDASAR